MELILEPYAEQQARLPKNGRHIVAQFDQSSIVVYQAYMPEIGQWAVENMQFGRSFSFKRMSWLKPSFLWMMYRSGWATNPGQEMVLAIWLKRAAFEAILEQAVPSAFDTAIYAKEEDWSGAIAGSQVRLQWDPDRGPGGQPLDRRAIQLGLRGQMLLQYASKWISDIQDISRFAREQARHARGTEAQESLLVPRVELYHPASNKVRERIGLDRQDKFRDDAE